MDLPISPECRTQDDSATFEQECSLHYRKRVWAYADQLRRMQSFFDEYRQVHLWHGGTTMWFAGNAIISELVKTRQRNGIFVLSRTNSHAFNRFSVQLLIRVGRDGSEFPGWRRNIYMTKRRVHLTQTWNPLDNPFSWNVGENTRRVHDLGQFLNTSNIGTWTGQLESWSLQKWSGLSEKGRDTPIVSESCFFFFCWRSHINIARQTVTLKLSFEV